MPEASPAPITMVRGAPSLFHLTLTLTLTLAFHQPCSRKFNCVTGIKMLIDVGVATGAGHLGQPSALVCAEQVRTGEELELLIEYRGWMPIHQPFRIVSTMSEKP